MSPFLLADAEFSLYAEVDGLPSGGALFQAACADQIECTPIPEQVTHVATGAKTPTKHTLAVKWRIDIDRAWLMGQAVDASGLDWFATYILQVAFKTPGNASRTRLELFTGCTVINEVLRPRGVDEMRNLPSFEASNRYLQTAGTTITEFLTSL